MDHHFLMLGDSHGPNLLGSYGRALRAMGCAVSDFDLPAAIQAVVPLGRLGSLLQRVVKHEPWYVQGNRELVREARRVQCTTLVAAGAAPVRAGALAQIKASLPGCRAVLMWPDPMQNLQPHVLAALPIYDVVCTYSSASIPMLYALGARRVEFFPFAADPELFQKPEATASERERYGCDISFVGNWRPEREQALLALVRAGLRVKIWGADYWKTRTSSRELVDGPFQGHPVVGRDFALAVSCPHLTLNVLDDTNYPAANMRSFEALACGAALVSSPCPEWDGEMRDGEVAAFYDGEERLVEVVKRLLSEPEAQRRLRQGGYDWVTRGHTYHDRARKLVEMLEATESEASSKRPGRESARSKG